jgi:hypothetical protein
MNSEGLDSDTKIKLTGMLRRFIDGDDRSPEFAGEMETAFEEVFGEEKPFDCFVAALARYRPGGGEYLYDAEQIADYCCRILRMLWRDEPEKNGKRV